jgi:hypothetical protein
MILFATATGLDGPGKSASRVTASSREATSFAGSEPAHPVYADASTSVRGRSGCRR